MKLFKLQKKLFKSKKAMKVDWLKVEWLNS